MNGICRLLPEDARQLLIEAAQIKDDWERKLAIEAATEKVRRLYPQYFREDNSNANFIKKR